MSEYYWALECSFGRCAGCNYLAPIRVGLDARMHDRVRYACPSCGAENIVSLVMRGAWPSPAYGPDPVATTPVPDRAIRRRLGPSVVDAGD